MRDHTVPPASSLAHAGHDQWSYLPSGSCMANLAAVILGMAQRGPAGLSCSAVMASSSSRARPAGLTFRWCSAVPYPKRLRLGWPCNSQMAGMTTGHARRELDSLQVAQRGPS